MVLDAICFMLADVHTIAIHCIEHLCDFINSHEILRPPVKKQVPKAPKLPHLTLGPRELCEGLESPWAALWMDFSFCFPMARQESPGPSQLAQKTYIGNGGALVRVIKGPLIENTGWRGKKSAFGIKTGVPTMGGQKVKFSDSVNLHGKTQLH